MSSVASSSKVINTATCFVVQMILKNPFSSGGKNWIIYACQIQKSQPMDMLVCFEIVVGNSVHYVWSNSSFVLLETNNYIFI